MSVSVKGNLWVDRNENVVARFATQKAAEYAFAMVLPPRNLTPDLPQQLNNRINIGDSE